MRMIRVRRGTPIFQRHAGRIGGKFLCAALLALLAFPVSADVGVASIDDVPESSTAPAGAVTVCPSGCAYETIRQAVAAAANSEVWVYGGPGPDPLTYRGFAVNKPGVKVIGYGAVRPLIVSDRKVGQDAGVPDKDIKRQFDGHEKGPILLGINADGAVLRDLNMTGLPVHQDVAGGVFAMVGYRLKDGKRRSFTIERMGFDHTRQAVFVGVSHVPLDVTIRHIWSRGHSGWGMVHGIYAGHKDGTLLVEESRFYKALGSGNHGGHHVKSRMPVTVVRNNVFGEPGDKASSHVQPEATVVDLTVTGNHFYHSSSNANRSLIQFGKRGGKLRRFVLRDNVMEMHNGDGAAVILAYAPLDEWVEEYDFANNRLVKRLSAAYGGGPSKVPLERSYLYAEAWNKLHYMAMPGIEAAD